MRSGYTDDLDQRDLAMWRGRVASSIRGKRGQSLCKLLLKALDEMPDKKLIREEFVDSTGAVCALGAGAEAIGMADIDNIDPDNHDELAKLFDVAACLIQEIEYMNDEYGLSTETPEQRYVRMRKWLAEQIKGEGSNQ